MSDEQRRDDEIDVEAHTNKAGVNDEPLDDAEDEIEAHVYKVSNIRMDSPSDT
jgi:hypothetical protein